MVAARLRAFCGPNGSGKTTLLRKLETGPARLPLGLVVNADDLLAQWRSPHGIDTSAWPPGWNLSALVASLRASGSVARSSLPLPSLSIAGSTLHASGPVDAYHAAGLAAWLREHLLSGGHDFSFETVMSHPSKIRFLERARSRGYRVYLYWIVTEDSEVNVQRVAQRVREGGHDVPAAKIRSRYDEALGLLRSALETSDRAYLFDNSGAQGPVLVAEWEAPGPDVTLKIASPTPGWLAFARP